MKLSILLSASLLLASGVSANWFSPDPSTPAEYAQWNEAKLQQWLKDNDVTVPANAKKDQLLTLVGDNWSTFAAWSQDRYDDAQKVMQGLKSDAFDTWDESQLRTFLVNQGVVAPSGPREKLILAARQYYASYNSAASSLSSHASSTASSLSSVVSATASSAAYGDKSYQASKSYSSASKSASSVAASSSARAAQAMNDASDYVYSTWDDNKLRSYLEEKGVIKTKSQATRDQLLAKMKDTYASTANPVYESWSDSYMHQWLVDQGIVKSDHEKKRDNMISLLKQYYYGPQEYVWNTWSDSDLKAWLVSHNIIKSDAQLQRDKLTRLVKDNYSSAKDTAFSGWTESEMRQWLIEHGYLRTDAQVKKDELTKLMNEKYGSVKDKSADYLTWPDARLRAYLRSKGVDETPIVGRPSLLHETRVRYVQSTNKVESLLQAIKDTISNGVEWSEEKLGSVLEILGGAKASSEARVKAKANEAKLAAAETVGEKASSAAAHASDLSSEAAQATQKSKDEL